MMVGGAPFITFLKNGTFFVFDPIRIAELDEEFKEIMSGISKIWNNLSEAK
jgi:hypothetical protein